MFICLKKKILSVVFHKIINVDSNGVFNKFNSYDMQIYVHASVLEIFRLRVK